MLELINKIQKENKIEKYDFIHAHSNLPGLPGKLLRKYFIFQLFIRFMEQELKLCKKCTVMV